MKNKQMCGLECYLFLVLNGLKTNQSSYDKTVIKISALIQHFTIFFWFSGAWLNLSMTSALLSYIYASCVLNFHFDVFVLTLTALSLTDLNQLC